MEHDAHQLFETLPMVGERADTGTARLASVTALLVAVVFIQDQRCRSSYVDGDNR